MYAPTTNEDSRDYATMSLMNKRRTFLVCTNQSGAPFMLEWRIGFDGLGILKQFQFWIENGTVKIPVSLFFAICVLLVKSPLTSCHSNARGSDRKCLQSEGITPLKELPPECLQEKNHPYLFFR